MSRRVLVAAVVAGLLSACGSTVPISSQGTAGGPLGPGVGPEASHGAASLTGAGGGTGTATTGSVAGSRAGTTSTTGAAAGTSGATDPTYRQPVPGVTSTTIEIGFVYTTGRQQAASALGAAGVTSGDELAQWKLLVQVVNASGGLGGRTIKPVYVGESSTSTQSVATQEAAACQALTQDHHVAVALSSFEFTQGFTECLSRRGVPSSYSLETLNATPQLQQFPLQYEPGDLALDRQGAELGNSLLAQAYFGAGAVNGVIAYDLPGPRAGVAALEQTLKAHGITLKDKRFIPFPPSTAETGQVAQPLKSAQLAFATEGVNRVMFFDLNGLLAFLFMTNAETQHYRPRYGLTSQSSGTHLADLLKGNANAQLTGALGIGWLPVLDLAAAEYGPSKGSASRQRCRQIMIKGGQEQGLSSPGAELVATGQCDGIFALQAAFRHVTGQVSGAALMQALRAVRTGFAPAATFSTSFGAGRRDGVSSVRDVAYSTACSCFRYTSGLRSVS